MDTKKKVEKWGKIMGYTGNIPNCFKNICGPETAHIWEQLITKIKPKDEIDHIRRNIINHELNGNLPEHLKGRCKEIEIYKKKEELKSKKINLNDEVSEKMENLENLKMNLNYRLAQNEKLKEEISLNQQKEFLFNQKCLDFEKKIEKIQEKLTLLEENRKYLKNSDQKEIVQALNKLSNKINLSSQLKKQHPSLTASLIFNETMTKSSFMLEQSQFLELHFDKTNLNQQLDILNNKHFLDEVKKIVLKHDLIQTMPHLINLIDETKTKMIEIVSNQSCYKPSNEKKIKMLDFVYSDDINNRLMIMKCNKKIDKEMNNFETKLSNIYDQFLCLNLSQSEICAMKELVELKLKEIESTISLESLQNELRKLECSSLSNLETIEIKLGSFEKKLGDYDQKINQIVGLSENIDESIKNVQRETKFLFSSLQKFPLETTSISFLLENGLNKKEIEMFKNYDLGCDRKIDQNKNGVLENFEIDYFKRFRGLLKNVHDDPEVITLELIRNKIVLNNSDAVLSEDLNEGLKYKKYSMNELKERQIVIDKVLNDLEIVCNRNVPIPINMSQQEKIMKFWVEMPIDKFVDSKLLFNEKNFEYYKKLYESYYKKL